MEVFSVFLGAGLILAGASYIELKRLLQAKASVEKEKRELLREFLNLKKKTAGIPDRLTCFNCGRTNYPDYYSISITYDEQGRIDKAGIYCPVCLKRIESDQNRPAGRYVGRVERFVKEIVIPAGFTDRGGAELMKVAVNLLRRVDANKKR